MLRNGKNTTEEVSILRRKLARTKIRVDLFLDYKEYMRLTSDQEFSKFTKEEIIEKLLENDELNKSEELLSLEELKKAKTTWTYQIFCLLA